MLSDIWDKATDMMSMDRRISPLVYDAIIKKTKLIKEGEGYLIASCKDEYSLEIIKNINSYVEDAVNTVTGRPYKVSFIVEGDEKSLISASIAEKKISEKNISDSISSNTRLDPTLNFENFIVGDCNRFAQAASIRVSDNPGQKQYNPLFLYGNSGLGKTHLLHAIGNRIAKVNPRKNIIYTTCENFTNQFVSCTKTGNYDSFRNLYRNIDVLMIDDIQFLIGKEGTQLEFFNTFEALVTAGKQIVITSDKAPKNLTQLSERLTSRFQMGFMMDIQPPDYETRKAFMLSRIEKSDVQIKVEDEVVNYICENVTSNMRELSGVYNLLESYYSLNPGIEIKLDDVKTMLSDYISPKKTQITPELILTTVSKYYGISVDKMRSKSRSRDIITARNVAMYLFKDMLDYTNKKIGEYFGGRDHTTVINSLNNVSKDDDLINNIEEIKKSLPV